MVQPTQREFTEQELNAIFGHRMTVDEMEKIKTLQLDNEIAKLETATYQIKYIDGIGYIAIGLGYIIEDTGTETMSYFYDIFTTESEIKTYIKSK